MFRLLSDKDSAWQCKRHNFGPWVIKSPWRRKWQPTPVFSPGKSHGQRSLGGCKRVGHDLVTKQQQATPIWEARLGDTIIKKSKDMITIPFGKWSCFCRERNVYESFIPDKAKSFSTFKFSLASSQGDPPWPSYLNRYLLISTSALCFLPNTLYTGSPFPTPPHFCLSPLVVLLIL